jgi:hypothetical protein
MSTINIGDKVLVERIDYDDFYENCLAFLLKSKRQKIKKTKTEFIITPADVGKFAKTRNGKTAYVFKYDKESCFTVGYCIDNVGVFHCKENGMQYETSEDKHDLVGWQGIISNNLLKYAQNKLQ